MKAGGTSKEGKPSRDRAAGEHKAIFLRNENDNCKGVLLRKTRGIEHGRSINTVSVGDRSRGDFRDGQEGWESGL